MTKPHFKPYTQDQYQLPFSYEILIPEKHLVREVNRLIDNMDHRELEATYGERGPKSYDPVMMIKILVYAYAQKIYSSRQIAKAVRENIYFIWLAGGNQPDFRTINRFRAEKMQEELETIFMGIIKELVERGYIHYENYFMDGTKIEANAGKYTYLWEKNKERYTELLQQEIRKMLAEAEKITEAENKLYGDKDLEEMGEDARPFTSEELREVSRKLEEELEKRPKEKRLKEISKRIKNDSIPRLEKYEGQKEMIGADRSNCSQTDHDATFFRMKEDHMKNGQLKPGYNVQIGTENNFILHTSIHQKASDTTLLKDHIEGFERFHDRKPTNLIADAGYGSLENYKYLEEKGICAYVKYSLFHQELGKNFWKRKFDVRNWQYDRENDQFICCEGQLLKFVFRKNNRTSNHFEYQTHVYQCSECKSCPSRGECCKGKGNRSVEINWELEARKYQTKALLQSEKGIYLCGRRCAEVENVFGQLKWNSGFTRFHLRGLKKVLLEWKLLCIGHNLRRMTMLSATTE